MDGLYRASAVLERQGCAGLVKFPRQLAQRNSVTLVQNAVTRARNVPMTSDTDGLTDPAEGGSYEDDSSPEPPLPGDSSGGAKTTQCPTCGRLFMGDY